MTKSNQFITKNRLLDTIRYAIIDFKNNEVLTSNHLNLKQALRIKKEEFFNSPNLCIALTKNDIALYEVTSKGNRASKRFAINDLWNRS